MANVSQPQKPGQIVTPQTASLDTTPDEHLVPVPTARPVRTESLVPTPTPRPDRAEDGVPLASATTEAITPDQRAKNDALRRSATDQREPSRGSNYYFERSGGTVRNYTIKTPASPKAPRVDVRGAVDRVDTEGRSVVRSVDRQVRKAGTAARDLATQADKTAARLDRTNLTGGAESLARNGGRVISGSPTGIAETVNGASRSINRSLAGLTELLPKGSKFDVSMPYPLSYTDRNGSKMYFPAGSRVVAENGSVKILSQGAYVKAGSIVVNAGQAELNLGTRENIGRFERLHVETKLGTADFQGITTRLQANGATTAHADRIAIDLTKGSLHANNITFDSPNASTLSATADSLAFRNNSVAVSTGATSLSQTTLNGVTSTDAAVNALDLARGSQRLTADTMSLNLTRRANGDGALRWAGTGVKFDDGKNHFDVAAATLGFTKRADGSTLHLETRDGHLALGNRDFRTTGNAAFDLVYNRDGQLTDATGRAQNIAFTDTSTNLTATGTRLHARFDDAGHLTGLDGGADRFNLALRDGSKLDVTKGTVAITREGDNILARARADGGSYTNSSGTFTLGKNSALDVRISPDTIALAGSTEKFTANNGSNALAITNGKVEATFGRTVDSEVIRFTGDTVRYNGTSNTNSITHLDVNNARAELTRDASGAMTLGLAGKDVGMTVGGNQIALENARNVSIATDPSGHISAIDMSLLGNASLNTRDGKTTITGSNVEAHYNGDTQTIRGSFDTAGFTLRNLGLTGNLVGGNLVANPNGFLASVASGNIARTTGTPFAGNFSNLTLGATVDNNGLLTGAQGSIGKFDGHYGSTSIKVNGLEGQSVSLQTRFDGNFRDAILNVPGGSSIVVDTNDAHLRIGQGLTKLSYDGASTWNLRSTNFEGDARFSGLTVKADGQLADVSLSNGSIFLNEIRGTHVDVKGSGFNVNLDIAKVDNVIAQFTGVSGAAQGAALTLTPSADGSNITARVTGKAAGVPFSVDVSNAAALNAYALVQPNQARFAINDPQGRGDIRLNVGGVLEMRSRDGQLGGTVTYRPFSMNGFNQAMLKTTELLPVNDNLRISTSGAVAVGFFGKDSPVVGGIQVDVPRRHNDQRFEPFDATAPMIDDRAFGVRGQVGVQGTDAQGRRTMVGVQAGFLPGSTLNVDIQGEARLFGKVPVPQHSRLPTTAVVGGIVEREVRGTTVTATAGVFVNPAAFAPEKYITEPTRAGAYAAIGVRDRDSVFSLGGTVTEKGAVGGMIKFSTAF